VHHLHLLQDRRVADVLGAAMTSKTSHCAGAAIPEDAGRRARLGRRRLVGGLFGWPCGDANTFLSYVNDGDRSKAVPLKAARRRPSA
jgi:hypothetical protein